MKKQILLITFFLPILAFAQVRTDTIQVYSPAMKKNLKAAVTTPTTYQVGSEKYPVLYLLHGASGAFSDWHKNITEQGLLTRMADEYNLIIVTPGVGPSSYYFDSPLLDSVKYETYITAELIPYIDKTFRTLAQKESRAITGLSMGGHGAIMLSAKHPELFVAAGSMSGVMNIDTRMWQVPGEFRTILQKGQQERQDMLGQDLNYDGPKFSAFTAVGLVERMKSNGLALIFDCGVDDFLIETNRQMHQLLLENGTPHEYIERPGEHTWPYWTEALPVHLLFFDKYLKRN